jgi:hypothetical protein
MFPLTADDKSRRKIKILAAENRGFSASTTKHEDAETNFLSVAVRVAPKQGLTKQRIFPGFDKLIIPFPTFKPPSNPPRLRESVGRPGR